jgi:molecular chaperone GrpE
MSKKKSEEVEEPTESIEVEVVDSANEGPLTPEDLKALQAKAAKADEHWERILRMTAEHDNFKKRTVRDRDDAVRYANERFVGQLLPVMDSFTMAIAATETSGEPDVKALKVGVNMILSQFQNVLKDMGVEELDASGGEFDPTWQEAMSQQETTDVEDGKVLQQLRKGYKLKGRLIRAASVIVAKSPDSKTDGDPDAEAPASEGGE